MARRINLSLAAIALAIFPWAPVPAQERGATSGLEATGRFSGTLRFVTREGQVRDLQVEVHHWSIRGGQKVDRSADTAFRLVQLVAGAVTTVIDGQRVERHEGEFWSVGSGTTMVLETGDDMAVLHVTTLR